MRVPLHCQNRKLAAPPGEKPSMHATISSDKDGISAPIWKSPPRATSEPPPPLSNDTFLPINPPNTLSTSIKQEGAREDTTKSLNRPDIKICPNNVPRLINTLPLPCARDNNATKHQCFTNRETGAAAKAVAEGAVAVGRGTRPCVALSARALFQELGVTMAARHHSALAVRYPRFGLDCTMGQLTVILGVWMMLSPMTSTSMMQIWPGGGGGSVGSNCGCHGNNGGDRPVAAN